MDLYISEVLGPCIIVGPIGYPPLIEVIVINNPRFRSNTRGLPLGHAAIHKRNIQTNSKTTLTDLLKYVLLKDKG